MIKIPDNIKEKFLSSKGDGKLSRSVQGGFMTVAFVVAYLTPYTESEVVLAINALLVMVSASYGAYGVIAKTYNKYHNDKI